MSVTLPMPANHVQKRRKKIDSEIRSRANSLHSLRDEMIEGLQQLSASVNVLKQGVAKIYEDMVPITPTYASPRYFKNFKYVKAEHGKMKYVQRYLPYFF